MKKIIKLTGILLAAAALLELTGCPGNVEKHEHTFAQEWSKDATHHWHAATCDHTDEVDGKAIHNWNEGVVTKTASCAEAGAKLFTCKVCHAEKTEEIEKLPHTWDEGKVTTDPTLAAEGVKTYTCTECGETKTESIDKLPYNWYESPVDAVSDLAATASSKYIYFGVFPRTVLPSNSTVTVDETDSVEMGANTYYRGSDGEYYAKQNGAGSYLYFKVEPILWKVLTTDYNGTGKALLLAWDILTANVPYYESSSNRTIDGKTVYPNNYKHSQIRAYLNGLAYQGQSGEVAKWNGKGFLQTSFTETAQSKIVTTTVDNSGASTTDATGSLIKADGSNSSYSTDYTCADTADKIFLLSEKEVTTTAYGFAAYDSYGKGNARIRMPTDYAKANYASQNSTYGYGGYWWLRSPYYDHSYLARYVRYDGYAFALFSVYSTYYGVVPALCLSLK